MATTIISSKVDMSYIDERYMIKNMVKTSKSII